jgi:hypothetical protein
MMKNKKDVRIQGLGRARELDNLIRLRLGAQSISSDRLRVAD